MAGWDLRADKGSGFAFPPCCELTLLRGLDEIPRCTGTQCSRETLFSCRYFAWLLWECLPFLALSCDAGSPQVSLSHLGFKDESPPLPMFSSVFPLAINSRNESEARGAEGPDAHFWASQDICPRYSTTGDWELGITE